jgi:hypothetical protein
VSACIHVPAQQIKRQLSLAQISSLPPFPTAPSTCILRLLSITLRKTRPYRTHGASFAARFGAKALLLRSVAPVSLNLPHTGSMSYRNGTLDRSAVCVVWVWGVSGVGGGGLWLCSVSVCMRQSFLLPPPPPPPPPYLTLLVWFAHYSLYSCSFLQADKLGFVERIPDELLGDYSAVARIPAAAISVEDASMIHR